MSDSDPNLHAVKDCCRCRGTARCQPAWTCITCGYVEPEERTDPTRLEPVGRGLDGA